MTLDFADRLLLAFEAARLQYERREGFLSDDDLLDLADAWTTDPEPDWDAEDWAPRPDREALIEALDAMTREEA